MTVSLIVSTYNWPEALGLVLDSVLRQSVLPTEIIVADDGSGPTTREVVENRAAAASVPIRHVWQEDEGFRLSAIRNKAIAAARGEYIVQIDGDVILHRHYIRDHMRFARKGHFTSGSRAMLTEELSKRLLGGDKIALSFRTKGVWNKLNAFRMPCISPFLTTVNRYVRGCNMAFWREDLLDVNGYNEEMTGWGHEDSEMAARLYNGGITQRTIKQAGIMFHLYHKGASRVNDAENRSIWYHARDNGVVRCADGLNRYL